MKKNMAVLDRFLRLLAAAVMLVCFTKDLPLSYLCLMLFVALVFTLTAVARYTRCSASIPGSLTIEQVQHWKGMYEGKKGFSQPASPICQKEWKKARSCMAGKNNGDASDWQHTKLRCGCR